MFQLSTRIAEATLCLDFMIKMEFFVFVLAKTNSIHNPNILSTTKI
jgi:hypothetical protein